MSTRILWTLRGNTKAPLAGAGVLALIFRVAYRQRSGDSARHLFGGQTDRLMDVHEECPRFRRRTSLAPIRAAAGAGLTLLAFETLGQQEAAPTFEVTSVKLAPQDFRQRSGRFGCSAGGGFAAGSMTVRAIIRFAYGVEYFQILGGPAWADDELYEIEGKPPTRASGSSSVTVDQCRLMLQSLLRDRFKLGILRESREIPAYALVVDKNGPKIKKGR